MGVRSQGNAMPASASATGGRRTGDPAAGPAANRPPRREPLVPLVALGPLGSLGPADGNRSDGDRFNDDRADDASGSTAPGEVSSERARWANSSRMAASTRLPDRNSSAGSGGGSVPSSDDSRPRLGGG